MRIPGLIALVAVGACYSEYRTAPVAYPTYAQPIAVQGPPGGGMDPGWGEEPTDQVGSAEGTDSYGGGEAPVAEQPVPEPSTDPQADGYVMGGVTDGEMDQTLSQHGEWIDTPEYGRVWRPSATVVGANFTPYETCGSWIYTDYGWTFSCEWDWGWLPFHYGQWDWYDNSWCWVPGYVWSPGWVDWRSGGGYVGWRPSRPNRDRIVRDHRDGSGGRVVRDHRDGRGRDHRGRESQWRFVRDADMGKRLTPHTRSVGLAEGISQTADVARPPVRAPHTVSAANVMKGRLSQRFAQRSGSRQTFDRPTRNPSTQGFRPPARQPHGYRRPDRQTYQPPTRQPDRQTYQPPTRNTYQPPTRQPDRQTYQPPTRNPSHTYQPPTRRPTHTYQPPTRQPTHTYQPPTRTHTPPSRTYSPPSTSSGGSRSYSPPSRSSSGSSSSRASSSSSSSSSSSRSSGSSSSGGSRSSSSSSSSGGGRRR